MIRKTIFFREPVNGVSFHTDPTGEDVRVRDQSVFFTFDEMRVQVPLANVLFITQEEV